MKISSFRDKELKFTGDLWTFDEGTDTTGNTVREFHFDRKISFNAVTGNFGKIDVFFGESESDVVALDQIFNFFGPDGKELMSHGVFQVEMIAPFINTWGHREGFRARLAYIGYDARPNS